jgi:predicted Rdx family selenoprotein
MSRNRYDMISVKPVSIVLCIECKYTLKKFTVSTKLLQIFNIKHRNPELRLLPNMCGEVSVVSEDSS